MIKRKLQSGLSMIEVLIVATILSILVIIAISMLPQQLSKGRDGKRKSDLQKIKIAFENYYSDNDCYPDPGILDNCESTDLAPYMTSVPCDPQTESKYLYAPEGASCPHYYRVFADLEQDLDPIIEELGCQTAGGCGAFAYFELELGLDALDYDYGVSEGVPVYVSNGGVPPGTQGFCCAVQGDQCNVWTYGNGVCVEFYFGNGECNAACGYNP